MWIAFRFAAPFNSKIRNGLKGRKLIPDILEKAEHLRKKNDSKKNLIIHSSSLGEFQQAIPLIEQLRRRNFNIICTFFSPSGYINAKIPYDDIIKIYLPFDSRRKVKNFLDLTVPDLIILMRYDLWFNFLYEAKKRNVTISVANARFDEKDKIWSMIIAGSFKKTMYRMIDKLFVIDKDDEVNYKNKLGGFKGEIVMVGDSKYERVYHSVRDMRNESVLSDEIYKDKKVFVIGSSWKDDEDVLLPVLDRIEGRHRNVLTILVPHEPKETKISAIERTIALKYKNFRTIRFSEINKFSGENLIIVNAVGKLAKLYSIAYLSYVGGGFRTGLHNILEPVIFNVPVFFANKVKNSDEDELLLKSGCGFHVTGKKNFYKQVYPLLINSVYRNEVAGNCSKVFEHTLGTAEKIVNNLCIN
jgi:3-deoxy-D-manno-octulosonic-acid transferase